MNAVAALVVTGLAKDYGSTHAVRGIDFEVQRGEVFGFLGPNGAGKSTTIRCILDLIRPTTGRISVLGVDPQRDGVRARGLMAYVPGELRLPDRQNGRELISSIGRLRGGVDEMRLEQLRERFDADLARPMRELSSGNRRKIALLAAFSTTAELLVLDEPTSGLDPLMQHEFLSVVREVAAEGRTVFLSSHTLSEVQRVADQVVVLRAGEVIARGTVEELRGRVRQRVEIWFPGEVPAEAVAAVPGIEQPVVDGKRVVATLAGPVQPLIELLARHPVANLRIEEPDLEEAFLGLYSDKAALPPSGNRL